jgi:hypothetical protein
MVTNGGRSEAEVGKLLWVLRRFCHLAFTAGFGQQFGKDVPDWHAVVRGGLGVGSICDEPGYGLVVFEADCSLQ